MKDKKVYKRSWFWLIILVIILMIVGSLAQSSERDIKTSNDTPDTTGVSSDATLPNLNIEDYKGDEGLVVYRELKAKGYAVNAEFEKQAFTEINGRASEMFESLDPNNSDDRQSVDAFVVGDLTQSGNNITLTIVHQPKD